ncbi:shieldin complex subunit 2 [Gastrophryne carolinensis]
MSKKKVVHVYIGAPNLHGDSRALPRGRTPAWKEHGCDRGEGWKVCRFSEEQRSRTPNTNGLEWCVQEYSGANDWPENQQQLTSEPSCCAARPQRPLCEAAHKAFPHELSEIETHNLYKSHPAQTSHGRNDSLVTGEFLDECLHKKNQFFNGDSTGANLPLSTETEFMSIVISSQFAIKGNVGTYEQSLPLTRSSGSLPLKSECFSALGNAEAAGQGATDECSDSSLELFTSEDESPLWENNENPQQVNGVCPEKSSATCVRMLNHHLINIEISSSKRKKGLAASFNSPSIYKQISKKPKYSLLNYARADHEKHTPHTLCTLLKNCSENNVEYNILAVVLQPSYIKEILVKSRTESGLAIPLATVVVSDQSEISCKVRLWRTAAFWSLALYPGDIIAVTNLKVCKDKWNGETLLQSTSKSCLQNLGNCFNVSTSKYLDTVEYFLLLELISYIATKHDYLRDLPAFQSQKLNHVQHVRLSQLQPELLVHSLLKVNTISPLMEYTYHYNGFQQNKVILSVADVKGQSKILILWGKSVSWCNQICLKRCHIWEFRYLLCKKNLNSGDVELHTTPWSSCECLFNDDKRAVQFRKQYFEHASPPLLLSLNILVEERYSGVFQIKGSISQLEFHVPGKKNILMTQQSSVTEILLSLSSIKYSGCGKCKRDLKTNGNHLYEQCLVCLPFNQVQTFYRPAIMSVVNEETIIWANVSPDVLQKIFLNISPKLLNKGVSFSPNITYGLVIADLCHSLLAKTGENYMFTIKSHLSLDMNSVPIEQEFHILDFHVNF